MKIFILALASIAMSVAAQFCFKAGMSALAAQRSLESAPDVFSSLWSASISPLILSGFGLYGVSAVMWLIVLDSWDVSKAYPMVGLGFAATLALGFLMGESISAMRVAGVFLIVTGVAMIGRT